MSLPDRRSPYTAGHRSRSAAKRSPSSDKGETSSRAARIKADSIAATYAGRVQGGAHLHFYETTHDFGDIPRKGGNLVREFEFVNDGTEPLVLLRVLTSCTCTKASFSKRPVAPGERGVVKVIYEPHKKEPGAFSKVIQIFSTSIEGRNVLTVRGNSIDVKKL